MTLAGRAGHRLGAGLRAAPLAHLAGGQGRHPDIGLLALEGLFQGDLEIVSEVAAAALALAAALAAHELAEHLVEDVGEAAGIGEAEAAGAGRVAVLEGGVAEAVVGGALLVVLQNVIGLAQLLELRLGRLVARVAVGVVLHGQLAIGLLQLLGAGAALDAQELIKIRLSHRCHRSSEPCRPPHSDPFSI
jgi:hypothetical protein